MFDSEVDLEYVLDLGKVQEPRKVGKMRKKKLAQQIFASAHFVIPGRVKGSWKLC